MHAVERTIQGAEFGWQCDDGNAFSSGEDRRRRGGRRR